MKSKFIRALPSILTFSFVFMALILVMAFMQNRDLKIQMADEQKELQRTCLMRQNKDLIEMPCTVLSSVYASTF